jgi:hypothetical protein
MDRMKMGEIPPGPQFGRRNTSGRPARNRAPGSKSRSNSAGFTHRYNPVERFVRALKVREPERFDVLESLAGE